jgi:hypothetical protein
MISGYSKIPILHYIIPGRLKIWITFTGIDENLWNHQDLLKGSRNNISSELLR